jgi:hypothetical protein
MSRAAPNKPEKYDYVAKEKRALPLDEDRGVRSCPDTGFLKFLTTSNRLLARNLYFLKV